MSNVFNNINPVCWFEIYTNDLERAKKFYEAVFQVELVENKLATKDIKMYLFPTDKENSYGATGAIAYREGLTIGKEESGTIVYFSCEDCSVEAKRITENDGIILCEKFSIGENGFIVIAKDTEGNTIGLHSMK